MEFSFVSLALWAVPVILAITLHEAAHGYVARMFGDPTAHEAGRITLNPLRHVDPIGTLLVPGGILAVNALTGTQFPPFGWAKPVPVNFGRLRHPKQDMLWVAAAGPGSNFVQALLWGFAASAVLHSGGNGVVAQVIYVMAQAGIIVNIALALLNLVPVPPLDGGRILVSLLPVRQAIAVSRIEPYGFPILIALLYFGVLDRVLWPMIPFFRRIITLLTGA
ncbi:MAG: site-2 protease family protein [Rhodocyclaceae bacterium]